MFPSGSFLFLAGFLRVFGTPTSPQSALRSAAPRRVRARRSHALRQILALDKFHHERVHPDRFLDRMDRRDVGMVQRRERLRLAFKTCQAFGVRCERVGQDLDRDLTAQRRVRRSIHFTHAADADAGDDFVHAETGAGREGQSLRYYTSGNECGRDSSCRRSGDLSPVPEFVYPSRLSGRITSSVAATRGHPQPPPARRRDEAAPSPVAA